MKAVAGFVLIAAVAVACTGTIDDGGDLDAGGGVGVGPGAGDASTAWSPDGAARGSSDSAVPSSDGTGGGAPADASSGSTPEGGIVVNASDGGVVCQTSVDSYGYTRCTCAPGVGAVGDAAVASCAGYACCVRYGGDSGLAAGFGDPALSSGLCGCFQSDDITAILGASASCQSFANDGVGDVVPSCP